MSLIIEIVLSRRSKRIRGSRTRAGVMGTANLSEYLGISRIIFIF